MKTITVSEARANLYKLLDETASVEEAQRGRIPDGELPVVELLGRRRLQRRVARRAPVFEPAAAEPAEKPEPDSSRPSSKARGFLLLS